MANTTNSIIRNIAEHLDAGYRCYYNQKTSELITIPNFNESYDDEEFKEAFKEDLNNIRANKVDFLEFEVLEPFESFKIMERFIKQIKDEAFKKRLCFLLEGKKPFRNFKNTIDNSEYRASWFQFKQEELEKIVATQWNHKLNN